MIRQSMFFTFNGRTSQEFNIFNVNMSTGMQSEPFAATSSIREVAIRGTSRRYFQDLQLDPLEFTVSFAFEDTFTSDQLREVAVWLTTPTYYSPLVFYDGSNMDLNMVYYAMFVDAREMLTNCANQGYVNLKVRCLDAYAYSGGIYGEVMDLSSNSSGTNYIFDNKGDVDIRPSMVVEIVSGTGFSITNESNGGQQMSFSGLQAGEVLTITLDENLEMIESSLPNTYRIDNMSGDFITATPGDNYLFITGNIRIQFQYEFKYIVG